MYLCQITIYIYLVRLSCFLAFKVTIFKNNLVVHVLKIISVEKCFSGFVGLAICLN